ncbi:type I restriction enzyme HsdR N-terminal domain-containing protein, partial [Candidatus Roizmanbacteria bacterium]|nr:type I restriction enzyme HsdR N-terminal domain-containing protein [Candidatus Roizmanbacteria bacterium]
MMKYTKPSETIISDKLTQAINNGYISITDDNRTIKYLQLNHNELFTDPEEKVRAEYYVDLINKYDYSKNRIELESEMPDRTPERYADIVIYEDDEKKKPYIVVECKKDGISDAEFEQAT